MAVPLLLGCIGSAVAQSLGPPAAEAWIGRPLEMTVPARFPSADGAEECVQAEVFYGDTRVRADRVRTTVFGPLLQRKVRIEADAPIDEPVVTVSLRAGCRGSVTRSYTLLPVLATPEMVAAEAGKGASIPAPPSLGPAAMAARLSTAMTLPAEAAPVLKRASSGKGSAPPRRKSKAERALHVAASKPAAAPGPRLKLEPMDFDPPALLRVSASLSQPEGDPSKRAAAALLWRALNTDPQEILRTSAMLQKLEHDLVVLRQADGQRRAELAALRQRLDAPVPWYRSAGLAQALAVLLAAVSALAGFLWMRGRRWNGAVPAWHASAQPEQGAHEAAQVPRDFAQPLAPQPAAGAGLLDTGWRVEPTLARSAPSVVPFPSRTDQAVPIAAAPQPTSTRPSMQPAVRVETLAATFGELEFLAAVGSARNAIEVLEAYLAGSSSPAPLAFFELMRLHAREEDASATAALRLRYHEAFGQEAPSLEQVTAPVGLDAMQELSARISRAWGTPEALHLIEQSLFEAPPGDAALTLQAGRELLSLYELAVALTTGGDTEAQADAHPLAPWADAEDGPQAQTLAESASEAAGGRDFALDVDLSAGPAALPVPERPPLEFVPFLAELQAEAEREAAARAAAEQEDAFSAAVAFERVPVSRY